MYGYILLPSEARVTNYPCTICLLWVTPTRVAFVFFFMIKSVKLDGARKEKLIEIAKKLVTELI